MSSKQTKQFDQTSFHETIANADRPVLVDFYADWCPPCKALAPIIDDVAQTVGDDAIVGTLNVDAHGDIAAAYEIRSIPTVIIFVNGDVAARFTGVVPKDTIVSALKNALALISS